MGGGDPWHTRRPRSTLTPPRARAQAASSSHLSSVLSPSADSVPQLPSSCASSIAAYNDCTDRHIGKSGNVKFRRVQERVPEEYRWGGEKQ